MVEWIQASSDRVPVGETVHYTVSLWNGGLDAARAAKVKLNLPDDAKVIDLQTDRGSCSVRKARCDLGDLAAGDIFQLHLSLKLKSPGRNTLRVHFTSDTLDPYLDNNTLSATTVVYRRR